MSAVIELPPAKPIIGSRWTKLRYHATQNAYANSPHRFNTVPSGRRSGKTERAKRKLVMRALEAETPWEPRYFAGAPTRDQAKRLFWEDLKALCRGFMSGAPSESDLCISLVTGAQIWVVGLDKPERVEGSPWDGGLLDEYGNMRPEVWSLHLRPALSDRMGWCDFLGVPEGRNHYYEMDVRAMALMAEFGAASEWGHYHWPSSDILPPEEIAAARRDLDELSFQQEYEGSFVNFEGRCYYPFSRDKHCAPLKYNPSKPLAICLDFNVAPGIAAVCQEQELPNQLERVMVNGKATEALKLDHAGKAVPIVGTGIIGEVHIPRNSNTPAVCRKLIADWGKHQGQVILYGDSTGGASGSAKVMGSDWDLVKAELGSHFKDRFIMRVKPSNPKERARVNAVNSRLLNGAGEIHLMVDGHKCPNVVKDFEGVALLAGGSGEIDKKADPTITHLTDGIGYYIDREFPIARPFVGVSPLRA